MSVKKKTLIESLKADKWQLPTINVLLIVFFGFLIFGTYVGFDEAVSLYGLFVAFLTGLILSPLSKNTLAWYINAPIGFHIAFLLIVASMVVGFATFILPKKLEST